jgi:multisite-specific tRNA:(cytosine-C5)-methyltransferase
VVDASGMLPGLVSAPGISKWQVPDKNEVGTMYSRFEDVQPSRKQREQRGQGHLGEQRGQGGQRTVAASSSATPVPAGIEQERRGLFRTMFPPEDVGDVVSEDAGEDAGEVAGGGGGGGAEEAQRMGDKLSRCLRILPHHQDTSGFFVCLLRKTRQLPDSITSAYVDEEEKLEDRGDAEAEEGGGGEAEVEEEEEEEEAGGGIYSSIVDIPGGKEAFDAMSSFYGLSPDFPCAQLVARSRKMSQVRYVSAEVRSLVAGVSKGGERLRVGTAGVLAFQDKRWEQDCVRHRLGMEGLGSMLPFMTRRIFQVEPGIYHKLLLERGLDLAEVPGVESIEVGTFVVTLAAEVSGGNSKSKQEKKAGPDAWAVVCWRGENKCLLFCDKEESASLLQAFKQRVP